MIFSAMKTVLKRYGFDDNDPLAVWLNAAKDDFQTAADWPFMQDLVTGIAVAAGANAIALPADFIKPIYIRDGTTSSGMFGRKLDFRTRRQFVQEVQDPTSTGTPQLYTIIAMSQVQIWPVPQSPMTYDLFYQSLIPDMAVDANPPQRLDGTPIPSTCHYSWVQRAASIALQAENEEERAQQAEREYQNSLLRLLGHFGEEQLDVVETVQDDQNYFGG